MKEVRTITNKPARDRAKVESETIAMLQESKILKDFNVKIERNPILVDPAYIEPGSLIMGDKREFSLHDTSRLQNQAQCKLYNDGSLKKIAIFYNRDDKEAFATFIKNLQDACETYKFQLEKPKSIEVNGRDWRAWESEIRRGFDNSFDLAVILSPGKKKNSVIYDDVKRFFLREFCVPIQVVIAETMNGKGVRSIVNNILVQMATKSGGTPWFISQFPFQEKPTMAAGVVFENKGKHNIITFAGTMNFTFSKYWSDCVRYDNEVEKPEILRQVVKRALGNFFEFSGRKATVERFVLYREGASEGREKIIKEVEVSAILKALEELLQEGVMNRKPQFYYVIVNKRAGAKFYEGETQFNNPRVGTTVDGIICTDREFYLINQAKANPTHYTLIYDSSYNADGQYGE